jgi:plasmid stability protein
MATLYVRDVPTDLYEQLRHEAASARRSIGAEAIELLRGALAPSLPGVSLEQFLDGADRIRERHPLPADSPSAAELIREDRER